MPVTPTKFLGTGADTTALALKMYTGSFVSAPRSSIFLFNDQADNYIYRKRPGSGKSFQYLMMGDTPDPEEFDPGDDLLGQTMAIDEGELTSDKFIVCHNWIGKDQMQHSHVDVLSRLGAAHRSKIDRLYDKRIFITGAKTARLTTAVNKNGLNIHSGGNRVTRAVSGGVLATAYPLSATGAANFRADLRALALAADEDNIGPSPNERSLLMTPHMRSVLSFDSTGQVFSKDYVIGHDQQKHEVEVIERFRVLGYPNTTSNNGPMPNQNIITGPTRYQGDFTAGASDGTPVALALCRSMEGEHAVGMIEFEPVRHFIKFFEEKLSWLVMTYMRGGVDKMHPWCAGSIEILKS